MINQVGKSGDPHTIWQFILVLTAAQNPLNNRPIVVWLGGLGGTRWKFQASVPRLYRMFNAPLQSDSTNWQWIAPYLQINDHVTGVE